ncbi:hypothetical protein A2U01_0068037, partial [Trifolium medium]|nr:hypothetical protein [Trifolium medium]
MLDEAFASDGGERRVGFLRK